MNSSLMHDLRLRWVTPASLAFRRPWPGTLRGLILWLFGLAFIVLGGINYIGTTLPNPTREYLAAALDHAPAEVYGWVFVAVGAFAMFTAYCHMDLDRLGYTISSLAAGLWGLVYVCSWRFYDAPLRAVGGGVVWLLFSTILTTCALIPKVRFHPEDHA